jgi:GH15 family glucan-1,4-alpha-glucosidase
MSSPVRRDARAAPCSADHRVIGDLRTVALVGADGAIDWCCLPRFDSPSVFGALLDAEVGGRYRIAATGDTIVRQTYLPGTSVLVTRFLAAEGIGEVQDFMPLDGDQRLIRRAVCVRGRVGFRVECQPRFDAGRERHSTTITAHGATFRSPSLALALRAPVPLRHAGAGIAGGFGLARGESATFVLADARLDLGRPCERRAEALLAETVACWQNWTALTGRRERRRG